MIHWSQIEEKGIIWGIQFLLKTYLIFGRRVLQVFLYPVVCYYWLFNVNGREASREYLQQVSDYSPAVAAVIHRGHYGSFLHFISFANTLIDKLASWSGALTLKDVEYHGRDAIIRNIDQGQGVILLVSHLGNMEVGQVIAEIRNKVTVNVLVHTRHAEKFNTVLRQYAKTGRLNLIQVTEVNAATAMMLKDKTEAGELVVIAADRTPVNSDKRVTQAEFLGRPANFPQGAFLMALLLKCPIYTMFCIKQHGKQVIYFDHFRDSLTVPRKQRTAVVQECVEDYAEILEKYCLEEPLQWFNFYDFWWTGNE